MTSDAGRPKRPKPVKRSRPAKRVKPVESLAAAEPLATTESSTTAEPLDAVEPLTTAQPSTEVEAWAVPEPLMPSEPVTSTEPDQPVRPAISSARSAAAALLWVVAAIFIALGAAGLVAAMEPGPDRPIVPGLTYTNDDAVVPRLDAAEDDVRALSDEVDALGSQARGALAAMIGSAPDTVDAAIAKGDRLLVGIADRTQAIRADLATVPFVRAPDADLHVSPGVLRRYASLVAVLTATDGLDAAWEELTVGAAAAGRLSAQLAEHDRLVGVAAAQGRAAKYDEAIVTLGTAAATIAQSRAYRDRLVATVDVAVLDQWLERNETYDKALAGLYQALSSVGGKVTDKVRDAIAAEKVARAGLPPDSRGLVVIMSDIGQGGLNRAVISIEQAKATLSDALEPVDEPSAAP